MVMLKIVSKVLFAVCLLVFLSFVTFLSQFYNPLILWVVSFTVLALCVILPYVVKTRKNRIIIISAFSFIINSFLLGRAIFSGSLLLLLYGIGFFVMIWLALFLLAEIVIGISPRRKASSSSG